MGGQTFLQQNLLPFLERHSIDSGRDAVPKRLHVVDLIFDGKRVKSWRRQWQGLRRNASRASPRSSLSGAPIRERWSLSKQRELTPRCSPRAMRRRPLHLSRDVFPLVIVSLRPRSPPVPSKLSHRLAR